MTSETGDNITVIYSNYYTPIGVQLPKDMKASPFYFADLLDARAPECIYCRRPVA